VFLVNLSGGNDTCICKSIVTSVTDYILQHGSVIVWGPYMDRRLLSCPFVVAVEVQNLLLIRVYVVVRIYVIIYL
jgi:hypothetical protein